MTETFGQRMRTQRLRAGLSQTALAERCGIPKPRLSRYENDHIVPSLDSLQRLAAGLGVTPAQLLGQDDDPFDVLVDTLRSHGVRPESVEHARQIALEVAERLTPADIRLG
jgi:transcriptional regulator with XRE-family HTH domain